MQNCSCTASAWHTAHRIPGGNELHLNANWRHLAMPDLCKGQKPAHELETCHYTEIRWNKPRETEKGSKRDLAQLPTCREQFAKKMWISLCVAWCIPMIFWMCYRECLIHVWLSSSCGVSCLLLKNGEAGSSSGPKRELHRTDTHTGTIFGTEFRFAPGQLWTQTSHMIQKKRSEKIQWSGFGTIFFHLLLVGKRKIWTKISPRPPCVRSCREYRSGKSKIWMWMNNDERDYLNPERWNTSQHNQFQLSQPCPTPWDQEEHTAGSIQHPLQRRVSKGMEAVNKEKGSLKSGARPAALNLLSSTCAEAVQRKVKKK